MTLESKYLKNQSVLVVTQAPLTRFDGGFHIWHKGVQMTMDDSKWHWCQRSRYTADKKFCGNL